MKIKEDSKISKILVVSSAPELADLVRESVGDNFGVIYAPDKQQGLEKARKEFPDIVALGYIEPQGTTFELHRILQNGWITKHLPLLVIDLYPDDPSRRVFSMEEGLQIEAEEYISLPRGNRHTAVSQLTQPITRLREKLQNRLQDAVNSVREAIVNTNIFCVTWEQIPGRGAFEMQQEELIENARRAARQGKIHAVSVTDNPGGNPAISTEMVCTEVKKLGIEPLVHLAFRDKNRNQCESLLYGLAALGVRNLLMLTGDYPSSSGFKGQSKPVFDLDSVHGVQMVEMMNQGMEHEMMGKKITLAATDFFTGVAVSPFKQYEAEVMGQYYKLKKKIEVGAKFIITQVGYDARKLHELLQWLKINRYNIPVLANIYILPYGAARIMNTNQIPGCVVTDKLLKELDNERKAEDKGRSDRLNRAAKMYAIAKGIGCAGTHIGGHGATYEMIEYVIEKGEELAHNWQDLVREFDYPQNNGFYLFRKDEKTGLNLNKLAIRPLKPKRQLLYSFYRIVHGAFFEPKHPFFGIYQNLASFVDKNQWMRKLFTYVEHLSKVALFSCQNCGDCALFDIAYLCPMSQCPKNQRLGPCGGSFEGWCEVYPNERKCIWVKAYERLKAYKEEDNIGSYIIPPCNWELRETSSWLNFYLGRDHTANRLGVKPPNKDKQSSSRK